MGGIQKDRVRSRPHLALGVGPTRVQDVNPGIWCFAAGVDSTGSSRDDVYGELGIGCRGRFGQEVRPTSTVGRGDSYPGPGLALEWSRQLGVSSGSLQGARSTESME